MTSLKQTSFATGEISPALYGRTDQQKYASGLATCRNWWVTKTGTVENRAGTQYVQLMEEPDELTRGIKFVFSQDITYYLAMSYSAANACVFFEVFYGGETYGDGTGYGDANVQPILTAWSGATSYSRGQTVSYLGTAYYSVQDGNLANIPSTSGISFWYPMDPGTLQIPIATSIGASWNNAVTNGGLRLAQYVQQNSIMTFVHQYGHPFQLIRYSDTDWRIALIFPASPLAAVSIASVTGPAGAISYVYALTSVDPTTGVESTIGASFSVALGTPSVATPHVITSANLVIASTVRVYQYYNGVFSFIGQTAGAAAAPIVFNNINITPNVGIQPPVRIPMFATANDLPGTVGVFQQRIWYANTLNQPQTVWASNTGAYTTFQTSTPITDSDAIQFTIAGRQVQTVHALVDLGKLIIHTTSGEYVANGNQAGSVTPTAINLVQQGYSGANNLTVPVSLGNTTLFVQARGTLIRDLQYAIQTTSYIGKDTTIYAPHLFANITIVSMDWQQIPNSILWVVLSNGTMLGMTYSKEQDMWGWHRHDSTNGLIEDVCVVPAGAEDVVYVVVKRTISDKTARYIERLANRAFADITVDAVFNDSAQSRSGVNTNTAVNWINVATSGGWTTTDTLTMTSNAPIWTAPGVAVFGDYTVGTGMLLQQRSTDGLDTLIDQIEFTVIGYNSANSVSVLASKDVPTWAQNVHIFTYFRMKKEYTAFDPLVFETVTGLGDGWVIPEMEVSASGHITTNRNYAVITVGLPITADLKTLDIENTQGETLTNKKKLVTEITAVFNESRGGFYGQGDENHLHEIKQRATEPWNVPDYLMTGPVRIPCAAAWQKTGQIFVRQTQPLPIGLSAVVQSGQIGN